ncbi:unnamed protein product [Phyllotreta striolata]|uniref:DUF155 domain-containing protein n=1 Tax=Phyllotreta striolata TaxID=444603 RepID=A0A9N9TF31_PHYSR|nr:unnamed protein product [Phyllotreta striolata]
MNSLKSLNSCLFNIVKYNRSNQCQFVQVIRNYSSSSLIFRNSSSSLNNVAPLVATVQKVHFSNTNPALQISAELANTHDTVSSIPVKKKRTGRKKKPLEEEERKPGFYTVVAFATAEEYNLENLFLGLKAQNLYDVKQIENNDNVIHAIPKYKVDDEIREIFFFRDGSVVMWNITDLESSNILKFLRQFEEDSYSQRLVQTECEVMNYKHHTAANKQSSVSKEGNIVFAPIEDLTLHKFAYSNGMVISVKLGIWEACLDKYISEMEFVTEELKRGKIKMTREEVLKKHGELFALRHYLNLSSDVLDTPDFYWDNDQLEHLYRQMCGYFTINKRTRVMNEKLNHCVALIELLSTHLSTKHSTKLEWTIIVLIMVEVFFETIHYIDRYVERREINEMPQKFEQLGEF